MRNRELRISHHARKTLLNQLEAGKWPSKLNSLSRVLDGSLVGSGRDTCCHPSNHKATGFKNLVCAGRKVLRMRQLVAVRNKAILKDDVGVLSDSECHLSLHLLRHKARTAFFNDKGLDAATVVLISRPDNHVAHGRVSDPAFLSVQDPATLDLPCRRLQPRSITAILRLSQSKAEDFLKFHATGKEALFLLLITKGINHSHADGIVDQKES